MDQETRNKLQRATQQIRRLLEAEFAEQLEGTFDILQNGQILPNPGKHLVARQRLTRQKLVDAIEHIRASGKSPKESVETYTREAAFTFLNRFVALRMLEARGLLQECVSKGDLSNGFKEFTGLAPGLSALPDGGYRLYLECLFDELSVEVKVLFDRRDTASLLWPRRTALNEVLDILGQADLAGIWREDETIGWVYQYFNSSEERKKMRDESPAPRNSRELAVRNQFFTPRYVVEFLTDNTLGRIWYEMRQGETRLKERCKYLVRRPSEVFLTEGEAPPPETDEQEDLSQEELLKKTVYIPHRPKKDPRELKVLDPACGSGHFLLYAFDLLTVIYEEAFDDSELGPALKREYPSREAFLNDVPRLILAHNLHGIDIDPRATQIASLALWMRAQRAYQEMKLPVRDRPPVRKSNIVCAEPMPGDERMLKEFIDQLEPKVLGQLVEVVFDKMKLAGEAGSLLKIEEEIRDAVTSARKQFVSQPLGVQQSLFAEMATPVRQQRFDLSGVNEAEFFEHAEYHVLDSMRKYSEKAESQQQLQRRLFAEDASRGFAFIDVCRKRYDVVLMNPPFGEAAKVSKSYIEREFVHSTGDILHTFVERGLSWLKLSGREGVISARTGFFLGDSKNWRKNVVFQNRLACFTDLGLGVLDDALVEVAAYVIESGKHQGSYVFTNRQLDTREKESRLLEAIQATNNAESGGLGLFDQKLLDIIPDHTFAYWAPASLLRRYSESERFGDVIGRVRQGVATADDFRFARLGWEVGSGLIGRGKRWQRFSKGGEYSPVYDDIHLLVDWMKDGAQIAASPSSRFQNVGSMFQPGACYPARTASAFAPKALPADCVFSHMSQTWFAVSLDEAMVSIGYLCCRVPQTFLELAVGSGDIATAGSAARRYTSAVVECVPANSIKHLVTPVNVQAIRELYNFRLATLITDESSSHFSHFHLRKSDLTLKSGAEQDGRSFIRAAVEALEYSGELDRSVTEAFRLSPEEASFVCHEVGVHPTSYTGSASFDEVSRLFHLDEEKLMAEAVSRVGSKRWFTKKSYFVDRRIEIICHVLGVTPNTVESLMRDIPIKIGLNEFATSMVSESLGCTFGRWDIRYATGEKSSPKLPDPFAPLPICPPGQLQNEHGLPSEPKDIPASYQVDIPWDGILVDDPNHPLDIIGRVRHVIEVIWKDKAAEIEHEAAEILGVKELRDYFRKSGSGGFWPDHIKRYSKSRRKAPIYWQLATPSASYSVWLYYHRFTRDTFFKVREHVKDKLDHERRKLDRVRTEAGPQPSRSQQKDIEEQERFVAEIATLAEEVERIAPLWNPNLNDGVIINFAPLWRLVPHNKSWQKECKECWDSLVKGEYDWAHLAMHLWPERVVPKCMTDASLAIAHGLEDVFWKKDDRDRYQPRPEPDGGWKTVVNDLVRERTSPAVKAALKSLLEAPVAATGTRTKRPRGKTAN